MSKSIKILFLSHSSGLCGSERALLDLLKGLDKERYEPLVLLPQEGPLNDHVVLLGIKTIVYPIERWIPFRWEFGKRNFLKMAIGLPKHVRFICKLIDREKINLVYTNSIAVIDGAIAAKIRRIPHIFHIHNVLFNVYFRPYFPASIIYFLTTSLSSRVILISNAQRKTMNFYRNKGNRKIKIIYYGFDIGMFSAADLTKDNLKDLRSELKIGKNTKIVALIGTYIEHKGQMDFIKAARIIADCLPDVVFILMGNKFKNFFSELVLRTKELGLKNKVHFLDFHEDIIPVYRAIDILVLASWNETFGRTIVEAMLMEKPVVATRCGGPEEIVLNGETGFLVPMCSPEDLAKSIMRIVSNPSLAEHMGEAGRKRAIEYFSIERYVSEIENVITDVVK